MLPRGLRPLATEETSRTSQMVTLLLTFPSTLRPPSTETVVQNDS